MLHNRKRRKVRGPMRDNSRNIAVHMTEDQYLQLRKYMALTRLNSTTYFRHLICRNTIKANSWELKRALHASLNKINSNIRQIARHRRARELDAEAAAQMVFLADKLCEEVYLLAAQK